MSLILMGPGTPKVSFHGSEPVSIDEIGSQFGAVFLLGALMRTWGWPTPWRSWWPRTCGGSA